MMDKVTTVNIFFNNNLNNPLDFQDWIDIISGLNKTNKKKFNIHVSDLSKFNDLRFLLKNCNDINIDYQLITEYNSNSLTEIKTLVNFCKPIKSLVLIYELNSYREHSLNEFKMIKEINTNLSIKIIVTKSNIKDLHSFISDLTNNRISSIIQPLDCTKSKFYDGIPNLVNYDDMIQRSQEILSEFKNIFCDEGLLIINREDLIDICNNLPSNMFCNIHESLKDIISVDGDGTLRLCPVIKGSKMADLKISQSILDDSNIRLLSMASDYRAFCRGCITAEMV